MKKTMTTPEIKRTPEEEAAEYIGFEALDNGHGSIDTMHTLLSDQLSPEVTKIILTAEVKANEWLKQNQLKHLNIQNEFNSVNNNPFIQNVFFPHLLKRLREYEAEDEGSFLCIILNKLSFAETISWNDFYKNYWEKRLGEKLI